MQITRRSFMMSFLNCSYRYFGRKKLNEKLAVLTQEQLFLGPGEGSKRNADYFMAPDSPAE